MNHAKTAPQAGISEQIERTPEELIRRHQVGVWRFLRSLGCEVALADDLTQETFLRVLQRPSFVQYSDKATSVYLCRVAHNLLASHHRKMSRSKEILTYEQVEEVWNRWAGADLSGDEYLDALHECLNGLTDRARLALRMRYASSSSRSEIGSELGITEHGARNLIQRAKEQLRECLSQKIKNT